MMEFASSKTHLPPSANSDKEMPMSEHFVHISLFLKEYRKEQSKTYSSGNSGSAQRLTAWILADEKKIIENLGKMLKFNSDENFTGKEAKCLFAFALGCLYSANVSGVEIRNVPEIKINHKIGGSVAGYSGGSIMMTPEFLEAMAKAVSGGERYSFNAGLHEGTHALLFMNDKRGMLSELASGYNTATFGLPVQVEAVMDGVDGVLPGRAFLMCARDFRHMLNEISSGRLVVKPENVLTEYLDIMIMPWYANYAGGKIDVMEFAGGDDMRGFNLYRNMVENGREMTTFDEATRYVEVLTRNAPRSANAAEICKYLGIRDTGFAREFARALALMENEITGIQSRRENVDPKTFMEIFHKCMNEVFGVPPDNIRKGFVMLPMKEGIDKS